MPKTTHIHHIVPRHMGGTDDPMNLIELTVEEHAEAHKELWEYCGHWEDKLAWKALSGQITMNEANREAILMGASKSGKLNKGKKKTDLHRFHLSQARTGMKLKPLTEEHKKKIGIGNKGKVMSAESRKKISEARRGRSMSEETKLKIGASLLGKKRGPYRKNSV